MANEMRVPSEDVANLVVKAVKAVFFQKELRVFVRLFLHCSYP